MWKGRPNSMEGADFAAVIASLYKGQGHFIKKKTGSLGNIGQGKFWETLVNDRRPNLKA